MPRLLRRRLRGIVIFGGLAKRMVKRRIEIGILYSRSGNYRLIAEACRAGAIAAIADINADPTAPSSSSRSSATRRQYRPLRPGCAEILASSGARHIIGCVTSWSRKEVIPVLEKAGGTLWYACPYEGFEANEHVVYMHACPNQHLVPLLGYVVPRFGADGFLHRLQLHLGLGDQPRRPRPDRRRRRQGAGRALPAARRDRRVAAGRRDRGDAAGLRAQQSDRPLLLRLHRGLCRACRARPAFPAGALPGAVLQPHGVRAAGDRRGRQRPALGRALFPRCSGRAGRRLSGSSLEAAAYASVRVLGRDPGAAIPRRAGPTCPTPSPARRSGRRSATSRIDPQTQHATLPVEIGRIEGGAFRTVSRSKAVAPDPYLSRYDRAETFGRPRLKVVS